MMDVPSATVADFSSSHLGTQEHWDEVYKQELASFADNGDVGEIWFGEDTQMRMVRWVEEKSELPLTAKIIDLGCGNGTMLMALREEGFTNLFGVDYSQYSIELARGIAEKEEAADIIFQTYDILSDSETKSREGQYDLCLDKGTYDAISLKDSSDCSDRLIYVRNVREILCVGGILLITSCNWTRSELENDFSKDFDVVGEIPAPSFTFGGVSGQSVTTLIMKRKDKSR